MGEDMPVYKRLGNSALEYAEDAIYAGIALLLIVGAAVLLIDAAGGLLRLGEAGVAATMLEVLDRLLLVFVVVELLFAVRITLRRREIVAEPFLIVGIIASIKEIVVLSVEAAEVLGEEEVFTDSITEIGVLGVLVLLLAISALLLRAKENKPGEGTRTESPTETDKDAARAKEGA
jgi:uncharacterized membrane protein (DUF373 family)